MNTLKTLVMLQMFGMQASDIMINRFLYPLEEVASKFIDIFGLCLVLFSCTCHTCQACSFETKDVILIFYKIVLILH